MAVFSLEFHIAKVGREISGAHFIRALSFLRAHSLPDQKNS
jgi:hypothetical protein